MTVEAVAATAVAPVLPAAPASAPIPISAAAASQIFFPSDVAVPQAVSGSVQFSQRQQQFHCAVSGAYNDVQSCTVWVRIQCALFRSRV